MRWLRPTESYEIRGKLMEIRALCTLDNMDESSEIPYEPCHAGPVHHLGPPAWFGPQEMGGEEAQEGSVWSRIPITTYIQISDGPTINAVNPMQLDDVVYIYMGYNYHTYR